MPESSYRHALYHLVKFALVLIGMGIIVLVAFPKGARRLGNWIGVDKLGLPDDGRVDSIIVLGGNTLERIVTGVDLYGQHVAPRLALTGYDPLKSNLKFDETLIARDYALNKGIPDQNFTLLSTTSTFEDAEQIARYVRQNALQQIVVVSDWTHARRAVCTIQAALGSRPPAIYFTSTPAKYDPSNWWTSEEGTINVFTEVAKMGLYTLRYGVPMWGCFAGDPNLLAYPILFGLGLLLSYVGVEWVRRNALHLNRIDIPNERSSHITPTPRGGGLGIVIPIVGFWLVYLWVWPGQFDVPLKIAVGFPFASCALATIGWIDDRRSLLALLRLVLYLLISGSFILTIGAFNVVDIALLGEIQLVGLIAFILTLLWLVGFLNIFNFMDGIDGLAGSQAFIASIFWLLVFLLEGQTGLALLACLLMATSLGFLFHNMPPARIFMGDVGSAFLGFTLAALPLMAYVQTSNARMLIVGIFFVAPFLFDGTLTILVRILRRENIFKPHRSHLYQQLVIAGQSPRQVVGQYQVLMLLSGACGFMYYTGTQTMMLLSLSILSGIFLIYMMYYATQTRSRTNLSMTINTGEPENKAE